jgi:hypothetical protein
MTEQLPQAPPINEKLLKIPFWLTPLPDEYLPYVAQATVLWGCFEEMFDEMLAAMVRESGKEPGRGWQTRYFKKRKPLFRKQAKLCFKSNDTILDLIEAVLNDSSALQRDRNIIVHGRIVGVTHKGGEAIEAHTYIKKKPVTLTLTEDSLSRLFHGLGHLCGRFQLLLDPDGDEGALLSPPDKSALRDFWSRNPQIPPSAEKPAPRRLAGTKPNPAV